MVAQQKDGRIETGGARRLPLRRMLSEQDIIATLERIGFSRAEIPRVLKDVGMVIVARTLAAYAEALPESERAELRALQPEQLERYLAERADSLPAFSQDEFNAIHDATWQEYFKGVG